MAVSLWVKQAINACLTAAGIEEGRLLRRVLKNGQVVGDGLSAWAIWSVVTGVGSGDREPRSVRCGDPYLDLGVEVG